jgi:sugar transferase (PEP-CTERM system associated)
MLKLSGQKIPTKTLLLFLSDILIIAFGVLVAICLRFLDGPAIRGYLDQRYIFFRIGIVVLICGLALYYNDLYKPEAVRQRIELLVRLLQSMGLSYLGLALLYYAIPNHVLGRGIAALAAPSIFLLLIAWRLLAARWEFFLYYVRRVLVVGTDPAGVLMVREIIARPELKMKVVGFLDELGENIGQSLVNPGIIGATADVEEIVARENIDCVILSLKERRGNTPVRQLLDLKFAGIAVEEAHNVWEEISGRIPIENLSPSCLIFSEGFRKPRLLLSTKRLVDFIAGVLGLILFMPIMFITAAAIWLETGRPILFRQERTGFRGRPFHILKFRSMLQDAEKNGPSWATSADDRITRVGRIIRKFRFDELPQFVNVLRGEMSLVGPRPERPVFCQFLEKQISFFGQRHAVRPGITGWAQVKYQYGGTVKQAKTKLEYDLFYIKHMSLLLDFAIILETAKVLVTGRGAK